MHRLSILALASAGLFAVGFSFHDPVSLKRIPVVGVKIKYTLDGTVSFGGMDATISGNGVETITAVDPKGTYTTESTQSDVTLNGSPAGVPDTTVTQVQKLNGEIVSISGAQGGADGVRFQEILEPYLPTEPLNVGDSFAYDIKGGPDGSQPIHVEGKLVAMEKVGNWDTAKIDETVKETTGTDPASAHETLWINVADGGPVKQVVELTNAPMGPTVVSNAKLTITRTAN